MDELQELFNKELKNIYNGPYIVLLALRKKFKKIGIDLTYSQEKNILDQLKIDDGETNKLNYRFQ